MDIVKRDSGHESAWASLDFRIGRGYVITPFSLVMSTMVDTFIDDTQMLDYQSDLDVPMNAHSSDFWLQEEEIMEEDSLHSHKQDHPLFFSQKSTIHQVSEHGISRLEMQSIDEEAHLLHSQMQSQSTSVVETVSQTYNTTAHHMHDDDQLPHSGMQSESFIALENAEDLLHAQTREQKTMDTGDGSIEVEMELFPEYEMLDDDEELDVEVYDGSLVHSSAPPEVYSSHSFDESKPQNEPLSVELPEESSAENTFGEQSEVRSLESFSPEKQQTLHFVDAHTFASETVIINEAEVTEDGDMIKGVLGPESVQEPNKTIQGFSVTVEELEEHNVHSGDVNSNFEEETNDQEGSNILEHEPEVEQADLSAGDPHEISEGVYIDPPPAVVLLVSTEVQQHFSLFNEPQEESSPNIQVILQHLPTLYYEPLHSVFEAFRQEEHLHTLFDTTNAELTLDAYELQLIVSEVSSTTNSRCIVLIPLYFRIIFMHVRYHCTISIFSMMPLEFMVLYVFGLRQPLQGLSCTIAAFKSGSPTLLQERLSTHCPFRL